MSLSDKCTMQYYYPTEELKKKYKINCSDKFFLDIDNTQMFNNEAFLKFVEERYGDSVFNGDSPFTFKDDYINLTNEEICKTTEYSLKPQQKFMGQFINPATNFNNSLVFHGLGSGKTCTSLVIGEAFKTTSKTKLLYVVPAPLIDQYRDEILGELKRYSDSELESGKDPEIWSCTSQCEINGKQDFYCNVNDRIILEYLQEDYNKKIKELNNLSDEINKLLKLKNKEETIPLKKRFSELQNEVNIAFMKLKNKKETLLSNITKVFHIESHNVFINNLFKQTKDGTWTKKDHLINKNSPLLSSSGILVIDEIQRLVSAGGVLYNKLFTAIYQYMNPECRIVVLSATPIYDNPYELALTMNLLRPRMPFPLTKEQFYSFFLGKYDKDDNCTRVKSNNFITQDSCVINKNLLRILSTGYVSYFRGGNPNAYPYKRIIVLEHKMSSYQKEQYINALRSDIKKDSSMYSKLLKGDEFLIKNQVSNLSFTEKEDVVSGIYVTTQQFSNIALPIIKSDIIDNMLSKQTQSQIKSGLDIFKKDLKKLKAPNSEIVLNYIREKGYSEKFVNIIDLSLKCNGPVFIFSNWLQFGVESLSIILDACGFKKFPEPAGKNGMRYFVWSSETSTDKELIRLAKNTFNSINNKDGSLIKIILGTRSIMEGVSFKNVKQVHITDPWWNEARIEQILARAVRFCSHSNLPLEEQYTDIFRHYSVLPMLPDPDVVEMLQDSIGMKKFKNFDSLTIEQKMVSSAMKKFQINNEFEETLKQVAYDCDLNKKGNIIRLEENVRPLTNGKYQIYFKNTKTLENFVREGIPDNLTFQQILDRTYSYPNDTSLEIKFYEVQIDSNNPDIFVRVIDEDTGKFNILEEPNINKNLTMYENIKCWNSDLTLEKIFDKMNLNPDNHDIISYFMRIKNNFDLYPIFRKEILGEKNLGPRIEFKNIQKLLKGKQKLIKCLTALSESDLTPKIQQKQLKKLLQSTELKSKINSKIIDIVYKYRYLPENMIEKLQELDSKSLNEILKEAEYYYSQRQNTDEE
jgi:hypothetical protein